MKKMIVSLLAAGAFLTVNGENYSLLNVRLIDGTVHQLAVDGLVLTFSDTQLKATGSATATFDLNTLDAMYFDEGGTSGISESASMTTIRQNGHMVEVSAPEGAQVTIANVNGMLVDRYIAGNDAIQTPLRPGIYIIKINNQATKINVR